MGGQGIIMRKVSVDKTLNQLKIFLKGSVVICLLYIINGWFIQKNLTLKAVGALAPMYLVLLVGFLILMRWKKHGRNEVLLQDIYDNFQISRFEEVKKLDQQLIQQIKKARKFVSNNGQVVGTTDFLLTDFRDGQFQLLPTKAITDIQLTREESQSMITINLDSKVYRLFIKKDKEAKELLDAVKTHYSL
ncbi:hypothetical protein [Enterococcus termitis]|uniref:Uncharacterized protein n=1 Tax=Enterococcus termitis TaxID=332950 RepID=A0A1E5GYF0_9ENTE|nr:hypothetical protein [Enterococcus termitis]OEG17751.1 hypothetical protein BCR25_17920 [Enterococcus termitis]OJG96849.1 hypothetical protein RV18_GL001787 [Enterococcus termitis]